MRWSFLQLALVFVSVSHDAFTQAVAEEIKASDVIQIPGAKLAYVVEGKGKPCLVLGSHLLSPKTFSGNLRDHLQLYFVDMRWFAREYDYVEVTDVTLTSIVEDLEVVREYLKLDKFVLVGQALNGSIAFEYVKRYPDRVSHLVMIGSSPIRHTQEYEQLVSDNWKTASKERVALQHSKWKKYIDTDGMSAEQTFVAVYDATSPSYWFNPEYDATPLWKGVSIHTSLLRHVSDEVFGDYKMFRGGKWVAVPTFVALGRYDYITPASLWKEYQTIPGLRISIFEKSGHMPQFEEDKSFDDQLLKWIKEN